jgi:hypothetical protein
MTTSELLSKIDLAVQTLFSNDRYLLEKKLNERSIAFKLAEYLQPLFNGYNIDSEYNGDAEKVNDRKALAIAEGRIKEIGIDPNEDNSYSISPDIIIHQRGHNKNNLVIIEVKKDISPKKYKDFDLIKLEHLTIDYLGNHYNYRLGIALILNTGNNAGTSSFSYFQNGLPLNNRQELQ